MLPISDFQIKKRETFSLTGKIKVKVLIIMVLVVFALIFGQLIFANSLATDGQKLSQIEDEIQELEAENTTLRAKIAQESSLTTLSKKAKELGFVPSSKVITP